LLPLTSSGKCGSFCPISKAPYSAVGIENQVEITEFSLFLAYFDRISSITKRQRVLGTYG
jgi:hypothetical protein